jgi:hypothetical protein
VGTFYPPSILLAPFIPAEIESEGLVANPAGQFPPQEVFWTARLQLKSDCDKVAGTKGMSPFCEAFNTIQQSVPPLPTSTRTPKEHVKRDKPKVIPQSHN